MVDSSSSRFQSLRPDRLRDNVRERLRNDDTKKGTIAVLVLAAIPLLGLLYMYYLMILVPGVEGIESSTFDQATIVYTADNEEITRYYTDNRKWVPIDSIADPVINGLIATEDRRFYDHYGIDIVRTGGAFLQTLLGNPQGGSTITMQLARNMFEGVGGKNVFTRKFMEYFTAVRLEDEYTKDEILELYLNLVSFNFSAYGIEAAAQTYYSKAAYELDVAEAATLVGMLRATTYYNPQLNPDNALERRNVVLTQMQEAGYITEVEHDSLADQPIDLDFNPTTFSSNMAPYFASYVRNQLEDWAEQNGYNLYTDGLRVYTTVDSEVQLAATEAVESVLGHLQNVAGVSWRPEALPLFVEASPRYRQLTAEGMPQEEALDTLLADESFVDTLRFLYTRVQGGLLAMDPNNGHIKAWVGGRNFEQDEYDHVYMAQRQPGSTFKPFVYATALSRGYTQNTPVLDARVRYEFPVSGDVWSVENFGGASGGLVPMEEGLARSLNTVTARLMLDLGADAVADMAYRMGIESELAEVPSLGLGTSPVTLLEMVTAYCTIADNGTYHEPAFLNRIEATDGRVIQRFAEEQSRESAVSPAIAYGTLDMMRGVIDHGTGVRMRFAYGARGDLAGKTGTTDDGADTWFFLLHPDMVIGTWVGFKSPSVTFSSSYWGQGAHAALPVVGELYQRIDLPTSATFEAPPGWSPPAPVDTQALRDRYRADTSGGFSLEDFFDFFGGDDDDTTGFGQESDTTGGIVPPGEQQEPEEDEGPQTTADSLTEAAQETTNLDSLLEASDDNGGE